VFIFLFLLIWILYSFFFDTKKYVVDTNIHQPDNLVQIKKESCLKNTSSREWKILCTNKEAKVYTEATNRLMQTSSKLNIVQIGAHVGFERNDPLATGIISLINSFHKNTILGFGGHLLNRRRQITDGLLIT